MQLLIKFLRFGIVGTTGMVIDFSITWLCREKLHFNKYIANTLGFSFAVINNFILNRVWTFENKSLEWQPQFYKAPASNPKHTIYAFPICIIEIVMRKGRK